jgi:CMP/dCMP kinase
MDSWTMPYLSKKGTKIWLHADINERAKRESKRNKISFEEAKKQIQKKDDFSKKHYKKIYGFSLGKDLSVFDYVVDTNNKTIKDVEKEVSRLISKIK